MTGIKDTLSSVPALKPWGPFYCHRRPERSFFFRGRQFPVCARCTGMLFGYCTIPLFLLHILKLNLLWSMLFLLPMVLDGYTQSMGYRASNNILRFVTGLLFGIGQVGLAKAAGSLIRSFVVLSGSLF